MKHKKTIAGTAANPIAIDTYENLYKCLDSEFYTILSIYKWFRAGLLKLTLEDLSYKQALAVKYLIEYEEILNRVRVY